MTAENLDCSIIDHIDEGIMALERDVVRRVNRAMERLTGSAAGELIGRTLETLLDPLPPAADCSADASPASAGTAPAFESSLQTADGSRRDVAVSRHKAATLPGEMQIVVVRDIDERKQMQRELLKSRQLESIAALSGGIAHDYNNLLTAIMGNISLVLTGIPEDDAIYDWLSQAQEAALIAKELTNRLITFSKGGAPQKETVDIAALIESATEFALSGANIVAEFDISADLWCADVDRTQIGQAFHNLVINAREAMPEGGRLAVRAENRVEMPDGAVIKTGRYVVIAIEDEGSGIAPDVRDHIFDPYFSTKEMGDQRGMGLGLSIANSIIAKHEGKITVASRPGEGACFTVFLPASSAVCEAPNLTVPSPQPTASRGSGKILVMDDEAMIRTLAGNMLTKLGYEAAYACNGEEAIEAYRAARAQGRPFDLVILDLTVKGGMGGKETIRRLRRIDPEVKAIVSSGYANDPGVTQYSDYGFCGVVAKPYRFDEIRQQLSAVLG
jgi:PAS domain S-box-containing protein